MLLQNIGDAREWTCTGRKHDNRLQDSSENWPGNRIQLCR